MAKTKESKTYTDSSCLISSESARKIISASSQTTNIHLARLLLLILSLTSTCSFAQHINTNTVIQSEVSTQGIEPVNSKKVTETPKKVHDYICPNNQISGLALVFSIPCKTDTECIFLGKDQRCCKRICRQGVPAPPKEPQHRAVLGLNRMCPKEPVPEILPVTSCLTDIDCEKERRVCCPDKDSKLYCRTAAPVWSELPFPRTHAPLMSLMGYMQCQMPPPPLLDLFPQSCNRTIDCFPNLCCQEGPNKFCRPAKKSIILLVAQATQRFARG